MAQKQQLSLASMKDVDSGKINAAFDHELKRIIEDCHDRPGMNKPRKLVLEVLLLPNCGTDANELYCESVAAQIRVDSRIPGRKTKVYTLDTKPSGAAYFNADAPENPDQMTIDDEIDRNTGEIKHN
jgi:hypothetical protein